MASSLLGSAVRAFLGKKSGSRSRIRPVLEVLEDRVMPYAFGGMPWANTNVTASFMPDGTLIGTNPSSLFARLNAVAATATWQREFARALQTWADNSNLNFHFVADDGSPSWTFGSAQGDSRFGDIRLGASPMPGYLAYTTFPSGNSGGGNMTLDSGTTFSIGGHPDLFSVLLHESGLALGLAEVGQPGVVMYGTLTGTYTGLASDDIAGIQALYGARRDDAYDAQATNNDFSTATTLALDGSGATTINADLTSLADIDYYRIVLPAGSDGTVTVSVDVSNLSLLAPKVLVFDAAQHLVGTADVGMAYGTAATVTISSLAPGQTYYVAVDGATTDVFGMGAYRLNIGPGQGTSPPPGPSVNGVPNDGAGSDINFQSSTTTLSANWAGVFSDAQNGITGYQWKVGTTPGGSELFDYTAAGISDASATRSGLTLASGQTYYVTVRATNGTGTSSAATSNGVTVDSSAPVVTGSPRDGTGADINVQGSSTSISANWAGVFSDAVAGITSYEWAIGISPGATNVQGYASVGTATSASASGLTLVQGQTYFVTVRACNGAGLSSSATSDGVMVGGAPLITGAPSDGGGADIAFQSSTTSLSANWAGVFSDAQSGISGYEWSIGTSAGAVNVQNFTSIGLATSATRTGLSLTSGLTYFVTVRATNGVGLITTASTNGVTVDKSAPTVTGAPKDGSGADINFQTSTTNLSANWAGVFNDAQSGITTYEWKVGTTSGGSQLFDFTTEGISGTTAGRTGLTLVPGQTYYVTVRARNGAGLASTATSNGVKVDNSAVAVTGLPRDGTGADVSSQTSTTAISANWSGVFSDAQSGITGYEWAIGTTAGGTDIQGFTSVGTATSKTRTGLALTLWQTYYVTVRATNGVGLTATASTNGVMVVLASDSYETNNTFAAAKSLGTFDSFSKTGLTINDASDVDYYKFVAKTGGTYQVSISFTNAAGNLDLAIYDSNQNLLASSTSTGDNELITLTLTAGQSYYIKVYSPDGAMNSYSLKIARS